MPSDFLKQMFAKNNLVISQTPREKIDRMVYPRNVPYKLPTLDLLNRPEYDFGNGQIGTAYTTDAETRDGLNANIPQIINGKLLSRLDALKHFRSNGEQDHMGEFLIDDPLVKPPLNVGKLYQSAEDWSFNVHLYQQDNTHFNSQDEIRNFINGINPDDYIAKGLVSQGIQQLMKRKLP